MIQVSSNGHKRAVLYARVSTDEQKTSGYGLDIQLDDCREYAARLGFAIVKEFQEDYTGFSAFADRPEGKLLMEMITARQADAVIAHRVDRIARDSLEARIAVRAWLRAGIEAHTARDGQIKNDNDIVFLIQSWQGQEDYTKIVANMKAGRIKKAVKDKLIIGAPRPPYGYHFVRDPKGKIIALEIYDPEARIVRLIFRWYVIGDGDNKPLTQRGIAIRLAEMGILSPRQNMKQRVCKNTNWTPSTVNRVISNETYAGTWHYLKMVRRENKMYNRDVSEHITIDVPAIVDRETWERAQARREYNAKMSKRNSKHNYFLRGRVVCKCGRSMVGHTTTTRGTKYYYYICTSTPYSIKVNQERCNQKPVRCDNLDTLAWESVKELFSDLDRLWDDLKKAQQKELDVQDPKRVELEAVENFIQQAEIEIDEIAVALRKASGRVGESLKKQMDDANARYNEYTARRSEIQKELGARKLTDDALTDIMRYAQDVRLGIDEADFETKQKILELLDVRVKIDGEKTQVTCAIASPTS